MKKSLLIIFMVVASSFAFFSVADKAEAKTYSSSAGNYQWGGVFNMPGYVRPNPNEIDLVNANVGFNLDAAIGCNGIDLKRAFEGIIDIDLDQIADDIVTYFEQGLSQYLLTQVYSSPALAAIFDSLEAFGNARVAMMQQKCNVAEARKKGNENIAKANEECLAEAKKNGDSPDVCYEGASEKIRQKLVQMQSRIENSGSLYEMLGGADAMGDLTYFIPDFKFCVAAERTCSFDKATKSEPPFNQAEASARSRGNALGGLQTFLEYMKWVVSQDGETNVKKNVRWAMKGKIASNEGDMPQLMIADVEERSYENPFISNIQLDVVSFAEGPTDPKNQFPPEFAQMGYIFPQRVATDMQKRFAQFINCNSSDFGLQAAQVFATAYPGVSVTPFIMSPTADAKYPILASGQMTYYDALTSGNPDADFADMLGAELFIGIATSCVYNHHMNMNPMDFVKLATLSEDEVSGILTGVAERISGLAVETVMRFTKHVLLDTYASGSFTHAELGPNEVAPFPEHAVQAVMMISEDIENRIKTLRAVNESQRQFSSMMADFLADVDEPYKPDDKSWDTDY